MDANSLVCLVLLWSESFLAEIFLSRFTSDLIASFLPLFYAFVIVVESYLLNNFAFVVFHPSNSVMSRSSTVVTAVTQWTELDTEFAVKVGSPK